MRARRLRILAAVSLVCASACDAPVEASLPDPAPAAPIAYVGQDDVLRGLQAIHVNPSFLAVRADGLVVPADLVERVERRLEAAGLRVLAAADLERDPGLPEMQIYPSASGDAALGGRERDACCNANIWISVLEGTALDRDPSIHRRLPVWGAGSGESCAAAPVSIDELVLQAIDRFIEDVRRANTSPDAAPLAARGAAEPRS